MTNPGRAVLFRWGGLIFVALIIATLVFTGLGLGEPEVADAAKTARASTILWGSVGTAGVTILAVLLALCLRPGAFTMTMEEPSWSFSSSWATNITLVGGLLGTVLWSVELPTDTAYLAYKVYVGYNLLFVLMILVAPLLYICVSTSTKPSGNPIGFLLAGALTEWAVVGQLATVMFLLLEAFRDDHFPVGSVELLCGLLVGSIVLVVVYCFKTMYSILSGAPESVTKIRLPL